MATKQENYSDREYKWFTKLCSDKLEPSLIILKSHLISETYLERIIMLRVKRADKLLDDGNLTYYNKLSIVESFDYLPDKLISCLKNLNKVRNKLSHELEYEVTTTDIDSIGRPLGSQYSKIRREQSSNVKSLLYYTILIVFNSIFRYIDNLEEEEI